MGSYDSAEVWKLVGLCILTLLANVIDKNQPDLYRGNGQIRISSKNVGFKINMKTNLKIVQFLNLTFNLLNGTFKRIQLNSKFNPVFSKNMSNNLVKRFLKLIDYVQAFLLKSGDCIKNTNFTKNGKVTTVS